jgi:hypothetical protein
MRRMDRIGPRHIQQILAVTDALRIHRESVAVPLGTRPGGGLRITPERRLEIVVPADTGFEPWIEALPERLRGLDLGLLRRTE